MKSFFFLLLITVVVISNPVVGQNFSNIKVNQITAGDQNNDGGTSIAAYGSNVYLLWQDFGSTYFSFVSKSTDGGVTFTDGVKVGVNDPHIFGAITTDNSGSVYVAWCGMDGGDNLNGIYFSKSTDETATFSAPLKISDNGVFPQIATRGNNVYIFFYMTNLNDENYPNSNLGYYFARSTNGGETFESPFIITDNIINGITLDSPNSMFVDNSGNIYCIWNDGRRVSSTDIYVAKSTDNGASFGTNIIVNELSGSSDKIRTAPNIAVSGSNVYVAWRQEDDGQGSNRKILFAKSTDGGASFGAATEIASGGWGSPSLALNPNGDIYIAYPNNTGTQNGIFCTRSNDQGNTFPVTAFINSVNANAKDPSIFVDANNILYSVWTDNRSGNDGVYFSKGTITITNIGEISGVIPTQYELLQNYPNPFNPSTVIRYTLPVSGNISLKVFDVLGKEVAVLVNEHRSAGVHEQKFDGAGLASGIYYYRITAGNYFAAKKFALIK